MLMRGKRSALYEARKESLEALRDAYTLLAGADWHEMGDRLDNLDGCSQRLHAVLALWASLER